MIVKQQMTRQVAYVTEGDDIASAHQAMKSLEMHHLPVLRSHKVVGMVSDRDILLRAKHTSTGIEIPSVPVSEVMTRQVFTCTADVTVGHAADLMITHQIHALPVLDAKEECIGIITSTDLLRVLRDYEWSVKEPLSFQFAKPIWWRNFSMGVA